MMEPHNNPCKMKVKIIIIVTLVCVPFPFVASTQTDKANLTALKMKLSKLWTFNIEYFGPLSLKCFRIVRNTSRLKKINHTLVKIIIGMNVCFQSVTSRCLIISYKTGAWDKEFCSWSLLLLFISVQSKDLDDLMINQMSAQAKVLSLYRTKMNACQKLHFLPKDWQKVKKFFVNSTLY